jgi:hypothetical protein
MRLMTSATGTTFSNSIVNADGTFVPGLSGHYSVKNKSFSVNIPAASAVVNHAAMAILLL